jgi:hypothetical protein
VRQTPLANADTPEFNDLVAALTHERVFTHFSTPARSNAWRPSQYRQGVRRACY